MRLIGQRANYSNGSELEAMSEAYKTVSNAMAALDRMTVDDLEHVDTETLRRLEALAYHWSEIAATVIQRQANDASPGAE